MRGATMRTARQVIRRTLRRQPSPSKTPSSSRWTGKDVLTISISLVALAASLITAYLSFFYVKASARMLVVHLAMTRDTGEVQVLVINDGNRAITVTRSQFIAYFQSKEKTAFSEIAALTSREG